MGLTFSQLEAVLTPANGALSVAASALLTPAVDTVFGAYLEASTLALTGAVSTPDAARQRVVVTGTVAPGSMLSLQSATLEQGVFALQNDGTVAVLLTVSVADAKWRLSTSFTQLADSVFDTFAYDTPAFTLDSMAQSVLPPGFRASFGYDPDVAEVADELVKGLSFSASLTASGTVGTLFDVLFSAPIPVSGPIETFTHTDPAAKKTIVFPQLLLDGASSSDRTQQIGTYTLTFHFQAASLLQEIAFTDAGVSTLAVLAAPVIAARTTLAPPGVDGFALSAFVYGGATDSLRLGTSANPGNDLDPSKLPALLNGTSPSSVLTTAQGFPALDKLTLKDASIALTLQPLALTSMEIAVGLAQGQTWNVLGIVTFDTLFLRLSVQYSGGTFTPFAVAFASAILANNPNYRLSGYVSMPDLRFAVRLTDTQPLDLTAIVKNLIGDAIPLPSFTLPTIDGILFEVDGDPRASTYTLQAEIEETWTIFGTAQNGLTLGNVTLHLTKATAGVTGSVLAGLDFAGVPLFVSAEYGGSKQWTFSGGTQPGQKVNLATVFQNLASMFGVDQPPDLPEVDLDAFALSYTTSGDPNVQGDFTLKASVSIPGATANLTALPLVGKYLSADDTVTLGDITFDVARTGGKPAVVTLTLAVQLGDAPPKTLKIPLSGGTAPQAAPGTALLALRTDAAPAAAYPAQGSGVWIDVQRSFGPLQIQRIGFTLSKDGVGVAFDAALSLSALKMAVMGLGVTIPLKAPFVPKFSIDGLDVELKGGAVTIAGGLLKIDKGTYLEFNGELIVKAANFSISAFGSYATTDPPSMFVFVMVNAPLGGPPFFFVTGVSGGFGFNRTLELPPIDEVVSYPFVQGASSGPSNPFGSGSTQNDFLRVMDRYIGVDIGENWLAAGLTFTSFELVDASVVLTVSFGTRVQIGLLGLATLTLPPKDPVPVAMAQMALEAVLAPAEGTLLVAAQLTTNSYVLAKSCQLTGGFAFAMWFPPSDFAGDFVVTLGGYNPYFTPPAHYPKVPRLGINWKIDGAPLVIKGGEYCALTPHSVMAGGGLSATWESGPISAWFNVSADFLIAWAPFHYRIDAGVSFGVRATIDIGITSFTISVSVGANLTIEGPPFSGVAYIDLSVVSFSIAFGNAAKPAKVTWTDFKSFLGGAKPSTTSLASAFAAAPQPLASGDQPAVVRAMVPTGLLRDLSRDKTAPVNYVVDPQHFTLFAQTQIPVVDYAYNGTAGHAPNPGVALGPMNLASFTSTFTMRVQHEHQDYPRLAPQLQLAPAPKALWAIDPDLDKSLNGVPQLPDRLTGFVLVPFIEPRHDMLPIPIAVLLTNVEGRQDGFWGAPAVPSTDPYENDDPTSELVRTIDAASGVRDSLVADLIATGFPLGAVLDTTPLTHRDRLNVLDPVELRLLGENRKLVSSAS